MKRIFLLLLLVLPYWMWLGPRQGSPHLAPESPWPFIYALLSVVLFLPTSWWLFDLDRDDRIATFSRIALGSAGGIALVYLITAATSNPALVGKFLGAPAGIGFGAVGFTRSLKNVASYPLWVSILGYTLGVGLIEEASKAITARTDTLDSLRTRAGLGFVSGIGFGIGEAILYSYRDYAGSADWRTYFLRFFFCVGFHGAMSGIAVLSLPEDWTDFDNWWITALHLLPIAFLHGAYDALLMRSHPVWAGIVATVTLVVLPLLIWTKEEIIGET